MELADQRGLDLGVPFMDDDHERLHALLDELVELLDQPDPIRLAGHCDRFAAEVAAHFEREETVMQARDYPLLQGHVAQHRHFAGQLAEALERVRACHGIGARPVAERALASLRTWFAVHIDRTDRPLAQWLTAAGYAG